MSPAQQSALLKKHIPLAEKIACHMKGGLPGVRLDELIQSGMIGLWKAAQRYEPRHGASFETYAGIRIKGEIVDAVRIESLFPRNTHEKYSRISIDKEEVRELLTDDNEPGRILEQGELSSAIAEAIEQLPEREKKAITLYYRGELSLKEIGRQLGLSESGAYLVRRQAEKRIAKHLEHFYERNINKKSKRTHRSDPPHAGDLRDDAAHSSY